jgi:hypothetical protein
MDMLSRAVLEEDPGALRSHNFVTNFKVIKGYYDWRNDIERWSSFVEIVGVDSYPNYIIGWPSMGRSLGKTVKAAFLVRLQEGDGGSEGGLRATWRVSPLPGRCTIKACSTEKTM